MSFTNNYNFVKELTVFNCADPSPIIWATTFIPAVAPALIDFASFGCRDIMKFRLGIGAPCGRMIKGQFKKAVPPAWLSVGEKLMKFEHGFSTAGFWFMIADMAFDTAARWSMLAYKMNGCVALDEEAHWRWEPLAPKFMLAGEASPVAGRIVDYVGDFGHATIIGAVAPEDWHLQIAFQAEFIPFPPGPPGNLELWIHTGTGTGYDFPATKFAPQFLFQEMTGGKHLSTQNTFGQGAQSYTMMARSDVQGFLILTSGNGSCSRLPPLDLYLTPLDCWKNLVAEEVENPQGTNRRGKQPNILDPFLSQVPPAPRRGPPRGQPRSKK